MYCSDHGEDMVYGHSGGHFLFPMVHVPLWIYLSPDYKVLYPDTVQQLEKHETRIFTNDLMFDTISGLLQARNTYSDSRYDLTSPSYDLPAEQALTMHGARRISEDPAL